MDIQLQVRMGHADVGARTGFLAEVIHNGILYLIGHELTVTELLGKDHRVYGKAGFILQILIPVDGLDGIINLIGRFRLEMLDRFKNADGRTQGKVGPIHEFLVAGERHHSASGLDVVCS